MVYWLRIRLSSAVANRELYQYSIKVKWGKNLKKILHIIYMRASSLSLCLTLCDPMDYSPPGSSVHGILQARILEWVATSLQGIFPTRGLNLGLLHCPFTDHCLMVVKGLVYLNEAMSHAVQGHPRQRGYQRVLTKCDPLEEGMVNHPSVLAMRIS